MGFAVAPPSTSPEWRRVFALPRRTLYLPTPAECQELTDAWRAPGAPAFCLRPLQAAALHEAWECGGLFAALGLGSGKTAITYLLPRVWGARRPLLLLPSGHVEKARRELGALQAVFGGEPPAIASYDALSRGQGVLEQLQPDAIIADEAHCLKDRNSGRTQRWERFMDAHLDTPFAALSATFSNASVLEYTHLLLWALKERSPVPLDYRALHSLAAAIDFKPQCPVGPGCLADFATPEQRAAAPTQRALGQAVWASRLRDTAGVIVSSDLSTDVPLTVRLLSTAPCMAAADALVRLRATWELPDGETCVDPAGARQVAQQLGLGFWHAPKEHPPVSWRLARREWAGAVRYAISHLRRELDTEGDVVAALDDLPARVRDAWGAWEHERAQFRLELVPTWLPGGEAWLYDHVTRWLREHPRGLVWVPYPWVGEQLAAAFNESFYHAGARCTALGHHLSAHAPGRPAFLAVGPCSAGHNLQAHHENLFLGCPPNSQAVGRTHRAGQTQGVLVDVLAATPEQVAAAQASVGRAAYRQLSTTVVDPLADVELERATFPLPPSGRP